MAGGRPQAASPDAAAAAPAPRPPDPLLGTMLGGCRLEARLGSGAMGAVYRARQVRLERTVAVKVMRDDLLTDRRAVQRFENEARTVARFDSAHVVRIHDVGEEQGKHYLVMEFVAGKNLRQHARDAGGRIDFGEAIRLLRQACQGLEAARAANVLHRDIKPDNLMLDEQGNLKIADFGIAKSMADEHNVTMTAELMGTLLYMSPEQCRTERDLDFRSDMYSLGATFFYLLSGEAPVKGGSMYELIGTKTRIHCLSLAKALPEMPLDHPLSRIIEKMTAQAPADRYADYAALLADLDLVAQGKAPLAEPPPVRPEPGVVATAPRRRGLLIGGGIALAAVAVAAVLLWRRGDDAGGARPPSRTDVAIRPPSTPPDTPPSAPAAAPQLAAVRARFRASGPSNELLRDLQGIAPATDADRAERQALDDVLQRALAARAALRGLELRKPSPRLPFDELATWLGEVDAAAAPPAAADGDLREWLRAEGERTRQTEMLRTAARGALIDEWAAWTTARGNGTPMDAAAAAALRDRLQKIRVGGEKLCALFETDAAALRLPVEDWNRALADLDVPTVDLDAKLQELRARFRAEGPSTALLDEVVAVKSSAKGTLDARERLLGAIDQSRRVRSNLDDARRLRPTMPSVPFERLREYYAAIDVAVGDVTGSADEDLRALVDRWRGEVRDEDQLGRGAVSTLGQAWASLRREVDAGAADRERLDGQVRQLELLRTARDRLQQLLPALAADVAAAMPAADIETLGVRLRSGADAADLRAAIAATADAVGRAEAFGDWQAVRAHVADDLDAHAAALAALGDAAAAPALRSALQALQRDAGERQRGAVVLAEVLTAFGAGTLPAAGRLDAAQRAFAPEVRALGLAGDAARQAFEALQRRADLDDAARRLEAAATALADFAGALQPAAGRIAAWQEQLAELRRAAAGLVPIAAGVPAVGSGSGEVVAFFLAPREVSVAEWLLFAEALASAWDAARDLPNDQRLPRLAADFGPVPGADVVEAILRQRARLGSADQALPIDGVSQYAAAMFARWQRRDLPTAGEWLLAAFGPSPRAHQYPWGDDWTTDPAVRSNSESLVPVDRGGRSWGAVRNGDVHHLVGNVAEWLEAGPGAAQGSLMGGSNLDNEGELRRFARGEPMQRSRTFMNSGNGLRTVLRPAAVFGPDWPLH